MDKSRLKKLAEGIDALAAKDEAIMRKTREIEEYRRRGAGQIHTMCRDLVAALNELIKRVPLELSPPEWSEDAFSDSGPNLIQINAKGRVIQIEFSATEHLSSTEDFRSPYTLRGAVRCYNQELLDRVDIQEQQLFYCLERTGKTWRFLDRRNGRSGVFDSDHLIQLLERLV